MYRLRKKKKPIYYVGQEYENLTIELEPSILNKLSGIDIQKMVERLPRSTALVFNLFIYEEYTHKEIASILNISQGTSKWHVSEAKRLLKTAITKNEPQKLTT